MRHKSSAGHRVGWETTMGKRIPRLAGGVAARHRKIDPFLCQRRYGAVANAAQLPYMIAKCTDSIWWRSAQQLEGGFASLTTAPPARRGVCLPLVIPPNTRCPAADLWVKISLRGGESRGPPAACAAVPLEGGHYMVLRSAVVVCHHSFAQKLTAV